MAKIKCIECNTILESKYRHDFQSCKCPNHSFVDGGNDYTRIGGKDLNKIKVLFEISNLSREQTPGEDEMLRITIEIVPKGIEKKKRTIQTIEIINRGTQRLIISDDNFLRPSNDLKRNDIIELSKYGVRVEDVDYGIIIHDFDRKRGAYKLIKEVCNELEKKGILK